MEGHLFLGGKGFSQFHKTTIWGQKTNLEANILGDIIIDLQILQSLKVCKLHVFHVHYMKSLNPFARKETF